MHGSGHSQPSTLKLGKESKRNSSHVYVTKILNYFLFYSIYNTFITYTYLVLTCSISSRLSSMCNIFTFDAFLHTSNFKTMIFTHKSFITPAAGSAVQAMVSYMWRCETFRAKARVDSLSSTIISQYSSMFQLHTISPSGPASSHSMCCVHMSLSTWDLLSCIYFLFGLFDKRLWGQQQAQPHLRVSAADLCVCERGGGLVSNLKQDLTAAVIKSRVF